MTLNKKREDDDRQSPDDAGGRHRGPVRVDAADQRAGAPRHGHGSGRGGQRESEQEFVERRDHREDRRRRESRRSQRKCDPDERRQAGIAIDHGGFLQIDRDLVEEAFHHPDAEGDVEGRVDQDQPGPGIDQLQLQYEQIDRNQDHDRGNNPQRQQRQPGLTLQPEAETKARDRVGAERTEGDRNDNRRRRHHDRIGQETRKALVREKKDVTVERRRMRIKSRVLRDLPVRLERGRNHPIDRQQHDREHDGRHEPSKQTDPQVASTRRRRRTAASARARMSSPMVTNRAAA